MGLLSWILIIPGIIFLGISSVDILFTSKSREWHQKIEWLEKIPYESWVFESDENTRAIGVIYMLTGLLLLSWGYMLSI